MTKIRTAFDFYSVARCASAFAAEKQPDEQEYRGNYRGEYAFSEVVAESAPDRASRI